MTSHLIPKNKYIGGCKQLDIIVGFAFLAVAKSQIVFESQYRLTDGGGEMFAAKVHAVKHS